ncbi:hypothetical protein C8F04DRAFT_434813 [Mycena alexandri]|uniref:Zinc-finger domain-containing protein n=1 Tax=Mycena alexandri TaxID=1745969 RepID=A0AAD6TG71_9AGAR|nr:hypothetical protein C8F04DRAFT_434813 [Mycena alexandri]
MDARHPSSPRTSVYVAVPLAPYPILHRVPSTSLKENEPWRVSTATMDESAASSFLKRKLSYSYETPNQFPMTVMKKPKLVSDFVMVGPAASEPPPPSYIYCHQCGKKRDKEVSAHCSYVEVYVVASDRPAKTRRCHNKYCKSCLKNRYNEDIDAIKANTATNGVQNGHLGEPYEYKCPKCRDVCNCSRCRKAKGLDPTGRFTNSTNAPAEKQPKPVADGAAKTDEAKAKHAPRQKAKAYVGPLPTLKWAKLRTNLPVEDAEARFHIREFVLRFFSKALPKAHLDELEHIGGNGRNRYDEEESIPWVSEACLKSILLAFLGVLAEEETNNTIKKAIQMGSKEMRAAGVGLAKMWQILASLRDALDASEPDSADGDDSEESDTIPSFPDPLPLPDSAINSSRRTRSTGSLIIDTIQMIPVVLGLIDAVVESTVIRTEIDKGAKESKDVARDVKDATRNANDMWEKAKKETENVKEQEFKARREAHKQLLQDIEGAGKVAMNRFNPRFAPLGGDRDGRLYYALSPGASDIESAFEFLSSMATETDDASRNSKAKRKRRPKREDERSSLKEWSWFVAVWGKKPPPDLGTLPFKPIANGGEEDDESDDDEVVDKWWAIWQPAEIRKLATWITLKYRLNENTVSSASSSGSSASTPSSDNAAGYDARAVQMSPHPSKLELLALVANLDDYAMGLEFRVRDGDMANTTGTTVDLDKGKARAA